MTIAIDTLSWNVQGEIGISDMRRQNQLDFLEKQTTDINLFLLQAVNYVKDTNDEWRGKLASFLITSTSIIITESTPLIGHKKYRNRKFSLTQISLHRTTGGITSRATIRRGH